MSFKCRPLLSLRESLSHLRSAANSTTNPSMVIQNVSEGPLLSGLTNGGDVVSIDGAGNEILAGTLTQSGTPLFRTKTPGTDVATYGARTAAPTLEDFGTAQLRNGAAFVSLDRTFASVIDARSYLVFVTPHGNSNGLFAETSPTGFTVRENNRGSSTVAFDYRIVAKPLDTAATHLPAMAPPHRRMIRNVMPTLPKFRYRTSSCGSTTTFCRASAASYELNLLQGFQVSKSAKRRRSTALLSVWPHSAF